MPRGFIASRSMVSWTLEPTRLRTTPATLTWVECRISVDHGGYGAGHRPGVDDEHYGGLEQPGDVGCGGEIPASLPSKRPMTPSITAMSAPRAPWRRAGR